MLKHYLIHTFIFSTEYLPCDTNLITAPTTKPSKKPCENCAKSAPKSAENSVITKTRQSAGSKCAKSGKQNKHNVLEQSRTGNVV